MSDDADLLAYYRIAFDACVSPRAPSVSELEYVLRTALSLLLVEETRRGYGRSGVGWAVGGGRRLRNTTMSMLIARGNATGVECWAMGDERWSALAQCIDPLCTELISCNGRGYP